MAERPARTFTSNFGVGRRESHDATGFYSRFEPPEMDVTDDRVLVPEVLRTPIVCGDARHMTSVPDGSVALVVTSPPYFAGKEYEEELDRDGVPSSYLEYLRLLRDVLAECKQKLEPGGRIAVNVANLGRKPYRSLSADVIRILEDDLRLLLRGEVIWKKAEGASGSCAWGSFRSPANPVLRDMTERVIIASKGRFDRARAAKKREEQHLPHESSITVDEFMEATLDVWEIAPESARRVNHPAPFPVELPQRLIELYTYRNDLVLDPFMGSGSTLVAAVRTDRRYAGYDMDPTYVELASKRVKDEKASQAKLRVVRVDDPRPPTPPVVQPGLERKTVQTIAEGELSDAGFTILHRNQRQRGCGVGVSLVAADADGVPWYFDVTGAFTTTRGGLLRTDTLFRSLGRASVLRSTGKWPVVFLTSNLPRRKSEGDQALRAAGPGAVFDAIELFSDEGRDRLRTYGGGGHASQPRPGFWTELELAVL